MPDEDDIKPLLPDEADIDRRFKYHPADTDSKAQAHEKVRLVCRNVAIYLNDLVPEGREKAVVMTKLEEAMFWANAALARHHD